MDYLSLYALIIFLGILVSVYAWFKCRTVRFRRQGDLAFAGGKWDLAIDNYRAATKYKFSGIWNSKLLLRIALVQLKRGGNPEVARQTFEEAFATSSKTSYKDFEKAARKLNVQLNEEVYRVFRKAELKCLHMILNATQKNVHDRPHFRIIEKASTLIRLERTTAGWDRGSANISVNFDAVTLESGHLNIWVQVVFSPTHIPSLRGRYETYSFLDQKQTKDLTDEAILRLLENSSLKSEIVREIHDDVSRIVEIVLDFCRGRRIMNDIDNLSIMVKKIIPVFWRELISLEARILSRTERYMFHVHQWKYAPELICNFKFDFPSIVRDNPNSVKFGLNNFPLNRDAIKSQLNADQIMLNRGVTQVNSELAPAIKSEDVQPETLNILCPFCQAPIDSGGKCPICGNIVDTMRHKNPNIERIRCDAVIIKPPKNKAVSDKVR